MEEGLFHYMARFGSLAFLQVFRHRIDLTELDVDRRSNAGLIDLERSVPGKTAMELAEWRRDSQSEWSLENQMDPDPDPEAFFTAFKAWIDEIRAAHRARSRSVEEADDDGSAGDGGESETGMKTEEDMVDK